MSLLNANVPARRDYPIGAGILLGLGSGGLFDGIVFHQILQWHHMASSAGVATDTVDGLRVNVFLDGLFHAATYVFVLLGFLLLWRNVRHGAAMSWRGLVGSLLMGFGIFNLVEGLIDHHILGLHHVNETAPPDQWLWWDLGFLASGAVLLVLGFAISRTAPVGRDSAR